MKFQGKTPIDTVKRIVIIALTIVVTFFVIFFLWIPLLFVVCAILLFAFIFRKQIRVIKINAKNRQRGAYTSWKPNDDKANSVEGDCVDAEYINLDKE